MTLKLRASSSPDPISPFSWDNVPSSPPRPTPPAEPSSPPTQWLRARDMKVFGASPLRDTVGIVKCKDCDKAVLRSAMIEHAGRWIWFRAVVVHDSTAHPHQITVPKYGRARRKQARAKWRPLVSSAPLPLCYRSADGPQLITRNVRRRTRIRPLRTHRRPRRRNRRRRSPRVARRAPSTSTDNAV